MPHAHHRDSGRRARAPLEAVHEIVRHLADDVLEVAVLLLQVPAHASHAARAAAAISARSSS